MWAQDLFPLPINASVVFSCPSSSHLAPQERIRERRGDSRLAPLGRLITNRGKSYSRIDHVLLLLSYQRKVIGGPILLLKTLWSLTGSSLATSLSTYRGVFFVSSSHTYFFFSPYLSHRDPLVFFSFVLAFVHNWNNTISIAHSCHTSPSFRSHIFRDDAFSHSNWRRYQSPKTPICWSSKK